MLKKLCYTLQNISVEEPDMTWWKRLFGGTSTREDSRYLYVYVQCDRCRTPVRVRVDIYNDAAVEFDDREREIGYVWRKDIVDAKCFRPIHAEITFDTARREVARRITGGQYIDAAAYTVLTTASTSTHNT
jgi:hypothetical protein